LFLTFDPVTQLCLIEGPRPPELDGAGDLPGARHRLNGAGREAENLDRPPHGDTFHILSANPAGKFLCGFPQQSGCGPAGLGVQDLVLKNLRVAQEAISERHCCTSSRK
jgi:hypothetical protein